MDGSAIGPAPYQPPSSLFALLQDRLADHVRPLHCSKLTLVDLSHTVEELIFSSRLPGLLFSGFQQAAYVWPEVERYRQLAAHNHICMFVGTGKLPDLPPQIVQLPLTADAGLTQEWFVLALTSECAVLLCAHDREEPFVHEGQRVFDTLWTFEPEIIQRVLDQLLQVVAKQRPDQLAGLVAARKHLPISAPDPRAVTLLTNQLIGHIEQRQRALLAAQVTLQSALEQALESNAIKMQLVSNISHELRTPLTAVLGYADMLTEGFYGDLAINQRDAISIIARQGRVVLRLINDVLDFSRLESNRMHLFPGPIMVATLLEACIRPFRAGASEKGLTLQATILPATPPHIVGDELRLVQIISNLLSNAIKYTDTGSVTLRFMTQFTNVEGPQGGSNTATFVVEVSDTGVGIPAQHHERIFEDFYRVQEQNKLVQGTGIGLAIVKRLVNLMGGRIILRSEVDRGSTFSLHLPLVIPSTEPPNMP